MASAVNWRGVEQARQWTIPSASQDGFGVQRLAITSMNQISFVPTCLGMDLRIDFKCRNYFFGSGWAITFAASANLNSL